MKNHFIIGKITNTHGVHGEMRVVPFTDDPTRFSRLKTVIIRMDGRDTAMTLISARLHKQFVLIKLQGVTDMNAAERLKGAELLIPDAQAMPLGEGEYYQRDLLDLAVIDQQGNHLGFIEDILETGANDVYVIGQRDGDTKNKTRSKEPEILLPAIRDCVLEVDLERGVMVVKVLEGLEP